MTVSQFTIEELRAQGMLMGAWYDMEDHTFNYMVTGEGLSKIIDADTHEPWTDGTDRFNLVKTGQIGAKDYLQFRKEMLGYERQSTGKDSI